MKGLLLKDAYVLLGQFKLMLLMIVVFAVIPNFSMMPLVIVYVVMLPVTALGYDERAHWDELAAMLPYTHQAMVLSKYVLGYLSLAAILSVSLLARLAASALLPGVETESPAMLALFACGALLLQAVNLPCMFRLGVEKGRLALLLIFVAVGALGFAFSDEIAPYLRAGRAGSPLLLALAAAAAANAVSIAVSLRLCRRRA